ncbi:hypothetical protein HNP40_002182 [Mycobacteroides chelonae]|nr:hypothetical protein [Mycobacteroides chelonae]
MSPTKQLILNTDQNAYLAPVQSWKQSVQKLESRTETFKGYVDKPGGTYWEGQFAEAAQQNAGDGLKTVGSIRDTIDALADEVTSTVTYSVLPPLTAAKAIINHAEQQQGVTVNDDLSMTYTPPSGMSDGAVEKSRQSVATMAKELKDSADKWWAATQTVKSQIEAGEAKVAGELNLASATFNVNNAVAQAKPADVPAAKDGNFYKDWYPQSNTPASTQAAAFTAVDPNAPKLGPPSPGDKPLQPDPRAGSLTGNLGALGITEPKSPLEQSPRPGDPRQTLAPKLDPNSPQDKAAIDTMRKYLQATVPADQVESRLADAISGAQQDRPMVAVPEGGPQERVKETFSDAYRTSWDEGIKGIQDMVGANGLDDFKDAWKNTGEGLLHRLNPINNVIDGINEAKSAIDNPEAFLGHKSAIASQAIPGLMLGGEGAAVRAGLPAEILTEGGAPASVLRGWNPTGDMPWQDFENHFGTPEARHYPTENNGFPPGYVPKSANLPAGTIIDRFGSEWGRYLAPDGTPVSGRAIAPESVGGQYTRYMLTGEPLPPGWDIVEGPVQPWFGQTPSPGVPQYMITGPEGVTPRVKDLLKMGIIEEDGPPLGR